MCCRRCRCCMSCTRCSSCECCICCRCFIGVAVVLVELVSIGHSPSMRNSDSCNLWYYLRHYQQYYPVFVKFRTEFNMCCEVFLGTNVFLFRPPSEKKKCLSTAKLFDTVVVVSFLSIGEENSRKY